MKYGTLFLAELGALCLPFLLFFLDSYARVLPEALVPYLLLASVIYLVFITVYGWYVLLIRKSPVPPAEEVAKRVVGKLVGLNSLFSVIMITLFVVGFLK